MADENAQYITLGQIRAPVPPAATEYEKNFIFNTLQRIYGDSSIHFVDGTALHDAPPDPAQRKQIYDAKNEQLLSQAGGLPAKWRVALGGLDARDKLNALASKFGPDNVAKVGENFLVKAPDGQVYAYNKPGADWGDVAAAAPAAGKIAAQTVGATLGATLGGSVGGVSGSPIVAGGGALAGGSAGAAAGAATADVTHRAFSDIVLGIDIPSTPERRESQLIGEAGTAGALEGAGRLMGMAWRAAGGRQLTPMDYMKEELNAGARRGVPVMAGKILNSPQLTSYEQLVSQFPWSPVSTIPAKTQRILAKQLSKQFALQEIKLSGQLPTRSAVRALRPSMLTEKGMEEVGSPVSRSLFSREAPTSVAHDYAKARELYKVVDKIVSPSATVEAESVMKATNSALSALDKAGDGWPVANRVKAMLGAALQREKGVPVTSGTESWSVLGASGEVASSSAAAVPGAKLSLTALRRARGYVNMQIAANPASSPPALRELRDSLDASYKGAVEKLGGAEAATAAGIADAAYKQAIDDTAQLGQIFGAKGPIAQLLRYGQGPATEAGNVASTMENLIRSNNIDALGKVYARLSPEQQQLVSRWAIVKLAKGGGVDAGAAPDAYVLTAAWRKLDARTRQLIGGDAAPLLDDFTNAIAGQAEVPTPSMQALPFIAGGITGLAVAAKNGAAGASSALLATAVTLGFIYGGGRVITNPRFLKAMIDPSSRSFLGLVTRLGGAAAGMDNCFEHHERPQPEY